MQYRFLKLLASFQKYYILFVIILIKIRRFYFANRHRIPYEFSADSFLEYGIKKIFSLLKITRTN